MMRFTQHFSGWRELGLGHKYCLGNAELEFVESQRDLGVVVDSSLKFHSQVRNVVHKASGLSSNLLRSTVNRSPEFMIALFISHIRPILDYCSTVFRNWLC